MISQPTPVGRRINQSTNKVTRSPPVWHTGKINPEYHHTYLLNHPFFLFFCIFYTTGYPQDRYQREGYRAVRSQWRATVKLGPMIVYSLIHSGSTPKTMHASSTGGSTAHFLKGLEVNQKYPWQEENMAICFTQPIWHGSNRLHLALPPPQIRLPHPQGLNLGTYNIWDGRGFSLP